MEYDEQTRYHKVHSRIRQEENLVRAEVKEVYGSEKMQVVYYE
jgi:hypothetical protein